MYKIEKPFLKIYYLNFFRCIANKKDMVTASYCTEAMQALHQEAQIAGISVVNEVGLDPGKSRNFSRNF